MTQKEFAAELTDGGPWCKLENPKTGKDIIIKDVIADAFLQQTLQRPAKRVTYDFALLMNGATRVSCSGFGQVMIDNMQ